MYRYLSDKQIDDLTSPYTLADRVPGFRLAMDIGKEIRHAHTSEVSKLSGKPYDGWKHVANVPWEVMTMLYEVYTPEELTANGGKILLDWVNRNRDHYGVERV